MRKTKWTLLLALIGGMFGFAACWAGIDTWQDAKTHQRQQTTLQSAPALTAAQAQQPAYLEGKISSETPTIHEKLVCFIAEKYRPGKRSGWYELYRKTPPLAVRASQDEQIIANNDYEMAKTPETVDDSTSDKRMRSRGFAVGSPIVALGKRDTNGYIIAETIYPGTREQYLAYLTEQAKGDKDEAVIMLLIGVVLTFLCSWNVWLLYNGKPTAS